MSHPPHQQINRDLLRPLLQTSWRFYVLVALPAAMVLTGLIGWLSQMTFGFGISGIRWPVYLVLVAAWAGGVGWVVRSHRREGLPLLNGGARDATVAVEHAGKP